MWLAVYAAQARVRHPFRPIRSLSDPGDGAQQPQAGSANMAGMTKLARSPKKRSCPHRPPPGGGSGKSDGRDATTPFTGRKKPAQQPIQRVLPPDGLPPATDISDRRRHREDDVEVRAPAAARTVGRPAIEQAPTLGTSG
jgi:hypothetical protein